MPPIHDNRKSFLLQSDELTSPGNRNHIIPYLRNKLIHGFIGPMTLRSWPDGISKTPNNHWPWRTTNHLSTTLFSNTSLLQNSFPTLLYKTLFQHFSTKLFSNTSLQNSFPTLLYKTLPQHFSTRLFCNTSPQDSSATLLHKTLLQHFSPTLFSNTFIQLSFQISTSLFSSTPTVLSNSSQNFSTTPSPRLL